MAQSQACARLMLGLGLSQTGLGPLQHNPDQVGPSLSPIAGRPLTEDYGFHTFGRSNNCPEK
ncbi:hypothetical protein AMTR_s05480p00001210 [Amborella trichopoda]|uniref:Uncharacterized protein n=1 Tax=Amborella trichopoda TaxID=13333 RepID=U5CKW3_AMBTC|nr:hypothetical protein AMTR_s05480p00001210 [Amborella trichopoda]